MGVAAEVYRIARETADGRRGGAIESVRIVVGELSAVEPDLLQFAWEAIVGDGPDAGARLVIDWRNARQLCDACGEIPERAPGSWWRLCPRCERTLSVEGGDELEISTVAFTDTEGREEILA